MRLAEFYQANQFSHRQLEWRISLALWALIIAAMYYIKTRPPESVVVFVLLLIVFIHSTLWVRQLWKSNTSSAYLMGRYTRLADKLLGEKEIEARGPQPRVGGYHFWQSGIQILTTALLAVAA
ncbi:MAG: hypothetical protein WCF66_13805 [Pseudolabrys sp.]|jgi:hypothetical protein